VRRYRAAREGNARFKGGVKRKIRFQRGTNHPRYRETPHQVLLGDGGQHEFTYFRWLGRSKDTRSTQYPISCLRRSASGSPWRNLSNWRGRKRKPHGALSSQSGVVWSAQCGESRTVSDLLEGVVGEGSGSSSNDVEGCAFDLCGWKERYHGLAR